MRHRYAAFVVICASLASAGTDRIVAENKIQDVIVSDAYVRTEADGTRWRIGSQGIEQVLECSDGRLRLTSYQNKLTEPATEYVTPQEACAPFALSVRPFAGCFSFEAVWQKTLAQGRRVDPANDKVSVDVKRGELVGFCVLAESDDALDSVEWTTKVAYENGPSYLSSNNAKLEQGPDWFYYQIVTGSGCMAELGEVVDLDVDGKKMPARVATGYRAPCEAQGFGTTFFAPRNSYTLVRAWKAPQDGKVMLSGEAILLSGRLPTLSIVKISPVSDAQRSLPKDFSDWTLERVEASEVNEGGRPAAQLSLHVARGPLQANLRIVAFPGTPVLRHWVTFENKGSTTVSLGSPAPWILSLDGTNAEQYTNYWLDGGTSRPNQGVLRSAAMGPAYHCALLGERSDNLVPWTAWQRKNGAADGCFVALDYLGTWNISLDAVPNASEMVSVSLPTLANYPLAPGETLELPVTTTGVFHRNLDDMAVHLYDWQYQYLWDYANADYYAKSKWVVAWFACARNLQEQFTAKIAQLNMDADVMRAMGFDMMWHDAGWAKYPDWPVPDSYASVFTASYEGPDFSNTLHYLAKYGMQYILWFAGCPANGVMDAKVASWGNFQWRTDAIGRCDWTVDRIFRNQVKTFLKNNPRSSFHTCCGGSRYSHQFEIMRLGDVHFLADGGRGPELNYYLSFLELPDKWVDAIEPIFSRGRVSPATQKQLLVMTPAWGFDCTHDNDMETLRLVNQTYDYLKHEGVVGRWSLASHPRIAGDDPLFYLQRSNHDRTKACIVLRHWSPAPFTVYPVELLPGHSYVVGFESTPETCVRTGANLMERGIEIKNQKPGELIYLGLPNRPGGAEDAVAPQSPGRALARYEVNAGHSGIGVYWSPGSDDCWISYYDVRRDGVVVGKTVKGEYYFDHAEGWSPQSHYDVCTVDSHGNRSDWTEAVPCSGEPITAWSLGGHFAVAGREGWKAETSDDGKTFSPMNWVPAARSPGGDLGGTPNQTGGVEGYWEGKGGARIGRGWQQAAADTACVRRWVAPQPGRVHVVGRAMKEWFRQNLGTALRTKIMLNDRVVWPANGDWADVSLGDLYGAAHDLELDVQAGDNLRFVLDRSADPGNAIVAWMPKIVYRDETAAPAAGSVVRIACGSENSHTDGNGNVWAADQFFDGGDPVSTSKTIEGASPTNEDQPLYQVGREGRDFSYSIPVEPGLYAIRLKFTEPKYRWFFERPFNVSINGREVLHNMDVCHVAKGPHKALEKEFRWLVPDRNGKFTLRFAGGFEPIQKSDLAMVQAIEVLPEAGTTIRIDCGSKEDCIDWNSNVWSADPRLQSNGSLESAMPIAQASPTLYDQRLYQTARSGKEIEYALQVPPGLYTVHLKFAELWLSEAGKRPMNIEINGRRVREKWDPATAAGGCGMAADVRVEDVAPNSSGQILIHVMSAGDADAILQAIEVQ